MKRRLLHDSREIFSLIDAGDRRRLRRSMAGSAVLALLDMVGVALVFPLTLLLLDGDNERDLGPLQPIAHLLGVESTSTFAALIAAAVLATFVGRGVFAVMILRSTLRTSLNAEANMAGRLLRGYLHAPLQYHVTHNTAAIQRTLGDSLQRVFKDALVTLVPATADAIVIALISLTLVAFAPVESIAGASSLAVVMGAYRRVAGIRAKAMSQQMLEQQRASVQHIQQSLGAVREIQLSGSVELFAADLLDVRRAIAEHQSRVTLTEMVPRYLLELGMVISAGVVGTVAYLRHPPDRAVAVLALFIAAVVRVLPSLNRVLVAGTRVSVAQPNTALIKQTLAELGNLEGDPSDADPISDRPFETLMAEGVTFRYAGADLDTLRDAHLRIDRNEYVGIMGGSGAGKTTLLNLILGLLDPTAGRLTVNGVPVRNCRRSWQQRVGYVPQDVAFLDASVLVNVALGTARSQIDVEAVRRALKVAEVLDVVESLPEGLHTPVREAGARLSGGQRQRIGLARALYREPEVLVLDEATSALDSRTEARLLQSLDQLRNKMTIIVVAHRPSTIAFCERVLYLRNGRIEQAEASHGAAADGFPAPDAP